MKIFIWNNGNSYSDFCTDRNISMEENLKGYEDDYPSSNSHSGGIVILAENKEEAIKLLIESYSKSQKWDKDFNKEYFEKRFREVTPVEIGLDKKGIILFAKGDC
jgi:hypothetical protein